MGPGRRLSTPIDGDSSKSVDRSTSTALFMATASSSTAVAEEIVPTRRGRRSPWVLALAGCTAGILCAGFIAFKRGDARSSQAMMRLRVVSQGATVCAMAITSGVGMSELGYLPRGGRTEGVDGG